MAICPKRLQRECRDTAQSNCRLCNPRRRERFTRSPRRRGRAASAARQAQRLGRLEDDDQLEFDHGLQMEPGRGRVESDSPPILPFGSNQSFIRPDASPRISIASMPSALAAWPRVLRGFSEQYLSTRTGRASISVSSNSSPWAVITELRPLMKPNNQDRNCKSLKTGAKSRHEDTVSQWALPHLTSTSRLLSE